MTEPRRREPREPSPELSPMASSLKRFLHDHHRRYPSMTGFAKASGLSRHTIMQVCDGRLKNITSRTRSAIFATTGLPEFSPYPGPVGSRTAGTRSSVAQSSSETVLLSMKGAAEKILSGINRLQAGTTNELGLMTKAVVSASPEQHVERIRQVLTALDQELAFFKELDRDHERELLRTRIDPKDVGYIIALLRALYSKESFDNWVLASGYSVK
jgi:hypothetical protein